MIDRQTARIANNSLQRTAKLKWTRTIMDYVEWMYGSHVLLNLNDGKVSLKMLFDIFNPIFGFKDIPFSTYFNIIRNRKRSERTTLLDLERQLLIERMEKSDSR